MSTINIEFPMRFDYFPTEIIFGIFDYLSSNDIIYTFFNVNQRFKNIILENKHYFNSFEFSTRNLSIWNNIIPIIRLQIECLHINIIDLSFPLPMFPNLKSLIITSLLGLSDEQFQSIFENDQFNNLHSLKINQKKLFYERINDNYINNQDYVLKKIFNSNNSLKMLQSSSIIPSFQVLPILSFHRNFNLHSLILTLTDCHDVFTLISYTPNLQYLNLHLLLTSILPRPIHIINTKLKQLYLSFGYDRDRRSSAQTMNFDRLTNFIQNFSLSLTCLSLNLVNVELNDTYPSTIVSSKLQHLLESIIQLKHFHFYAKLSSYENDILSGFKDGYWLFGAHRNYIYTLPFHFDYLYEFYDGFKDVKSSNLEILENSSRVWYNVKSIELNSNNKYNLNFIKELKIKMPNLTFIKFNSNTFDYLSQIQDKEINVTLDNVTTIEFTEPSHTNSRQWLMNCTPNLKHLIVPYYEFLLGDKQLAEILNKRIEQLDIDEHSPLKQLTEINSIYFSNVQHINFCLNNSWNSSESYANIIMKILKNFINLKTLIIYVPSLSIFHGKQLSKIAQYLYMDEILINYHKKHFPQYFLFSKKSISDWI